MHNTPLEIRLRKLYTMAYSAECDGHDRSWHRTLARNRAELAELARGADDAARELAQAEANFKPTITSSKS